MKSTCYEIGTISPQAVVYIATGGHSIGALLAEYLNVPLIPIDIRYPLSRFMDRFPLLAPVCWLFKEFVYRVTTPASLSTPFSASLPHGLSTIVLADDRVSTGRTLNIALQHLMFVGINRTDIKVVTWRCSRKSRHLVDFVIERD